jgi:Lhr-like helicase
MQGGPRYHNHFLEYKIFIAGRHLKIISIDKGQSRKITAVFSSGLNEKQLAWIGKGVPVSYQLSQAMGRILKTGRTLHEDCLFYRTEKLFRQEIEQGKNPKRLQNGIEVVAGRSAPLYFRTFLGSVGNLILEWSIREACIEDDFFILFPMQQA